LIPGAGGDSWYWHRVLPLLREAGHEAVAVDLPGPDPEAGLPEYRRIVCEAIGGHADVILVAASLGGFTAALVAASRPVTGLIFVNAMIPQPGETAGQWWGNTGWELARVAAARAGGYTAEFDVAEYFLHDVPPEVLAAGGEEHAWPEADAVFGSACDFADWPSIPIRVAAGADDRFFPPEFQRRVVRERLGLTADVLPGGHLIALARPDPLAAYLLAR
jgi:pimeloyl-ACP methyl ester carboxylesterase